MIAVMPASKASVRPRPYSRCCDVTSYSKRWVALFPQHGIGRKHLRSIALEPWQRRITQRHATALVRGLIHSDGSRYLARVHVAGREYPYVRYDFSNRSRDILMIFCEHLDLLGIHWTRPNAHLVAVATRAGVRRLDEFVGPKR
jgi:hypothetical protein